MAYFIFLFFPSHEHVLPRAMGGMCNRVNEEEFFWEGAEH